ncbi:hypothetical protein A6U87_07510 [Rhizobium sp. AC44/96]|uniref:hypothetical protein n=1 Tax=Rhizobium sp. AC44/96 TaxID=1841654 RepID=UPI000810086D|nr:hypothetical protein [Rhizobium sp. AC44/96]MDM9622989.1 hypothetical protein [Rhizobium sp. S96]OCJ13123.1 hypothetical protein A6U87_07510 [Rhizobium sp. AC44/96]
MGAIVAAVLEDPERFLEIASAAVSRGNLIFSDAAGRPISYSRFGKAVLDANPFLVKLTAMMDNGRLAGTADLRVLGCLVWRMIRAIPAPCRRIA